MAEGSAKVIQRCEAAKETRELLLDDSDLMKFPDAMFFLLKGVELDVVNLSHNALKKLPTKFGPEFKSITCKCEYICVWFMDIFLSHSALDLSHNKFQTIPNSLQEITDLKSLDFSSNKITSVSPSQVEGVEKVDLTGNPLSEETKAALESLPNVTI